MLIELFELACNHALEHDPKTLERLTKLQGKSMALRIKMINQAVTVTPSPEGLEIINGVPESADVILSATPMAILKISRSGMENADLKPGELEISGDPIIGQRFASLISELDINWENLLAEKVGDSPARFISMATGQAIEFAEQSKEQLNRRFAHFIQEELAVTVTADEINNYLDNVDTLRADVERLATRINRLQQSLTNKK